MMFYSFCCCYVDYFAAVFLVFVVFFYFRIFFFVLFFHPSSWSSLSVLLYDGLTHTPFRSSKFIFLDIALYLSGNVRNVILESSVAYLPI